MQDQDILKASATELYQFALQSIFSRTYQAIEIDVTKTGFTTALNLSPVKIISPSIVDHSIPWMWIQANTNPNGVSSEFPDPEPTLTIHTMLDATIKCRYWHRPEQNVSIFKRHSYFRLADDG